MNWKAIDQTNATYTGEIEILDNNGEIQHFTLAQTETHIIFGGVCNTGLLESGNFKLDNDFSFDENLQALVADLECYYQDGRGFQSDDFSCNDRM